MQEFAPCENCLQKLAVYSHPASAPQHTPESLPIWGFPQPSAPTTRLIRVSSVAILSFWVYHSFIAFISTLARSTAAEVNFRVDTVYGLLTEGQSRGQIIQFCANQWNVDTRQIDNYIKRARIRLEEDAAMTRPSWIAEALGRLRTYEQSAYKRGQTQVAINAVQLQAKLIGLEI